MQNEDILFKVAQVIAEQLDKDENEISPAAKLHDLGADQLDQIEIVMKTEELFNIFISDEDADKIVCVKDLVNCVDKLIQK